MRKLTFHYILKNWWRIQTKLALSYALSNKGATQNTGKVTGVLAPSNPSGLGTSAYKPFYPTPTGQPISQGNTAGLLNQKAPAPSTPVKKTTTIDAAGNTTSTEYHAPATNKTSTSASSAPQKAPDDSSYKYNTSTGQLNSKYADPNTPASAPLTVSGQVPGLLQAGQQTGNEAQTQRQVEEAGGVTQWENDIKNGMAVEEANKKLSDFRTAVAKKYGDIESSPIPLEFQQGREQALARQFASQENALQQGVANALTEQGQQFTAAQAQANRGLTAAQGAYTGAQTQAGRGLNAAGTALGAVAPVQVSPTNIPYNPGTGQYGAPASSAYGGGGLGTIGGILQQQQQGADTQTMIGAYNQAKPLIETAKQQIANANFNVSPLGLVNQLQQYVNKNVIPSGEYANIFNTLSEIATTISPVLGAQGAQTDLKTMIAQEFIPKLLQGQDIGMVLDNIERNALAKIQANKSTAQGTPLAVPASNQVSSNIWDF